jgi:hypothetical protein
VTEIVEHGLVPDAIQERERHWHRRHAALRIRRTTTHTFKELGEFLGVSASRARDMIVKAEREEQRNRLSPIEAWLDGQSADIPTIVRHLKRRANIRHTPNAKTQRPPRQPEPPSPENKIRRLEAKIRNLEATKDSLIAENNNLRVNARLLPDFEKQRDAADARCMDYIIELQEMKAYCMLLEERLGIRHASRERAMIVLHQKE